MEFNVGEQVIIKEKEGCAGYPGRIYLAKVVEKTIREDGILYNFEGIYRIREGSDTEPYVKESIYTFSSIEFTARYPSETEQKAIKQMEEAWEEFKHKENVMGKVILQKQKQRDRENKS